MNCGYNNCPLKRAGNYFVNQHQREGEGNTTDPGGLQMDIKKCPGCQSVVYCSDECQRNDWELGGHQIACVGRRPRLDYENISDGSSKASRRSLHDFEFLNTEATKNGELGRGTYGYVRLVKERTTGRHYAMKIMSKKLIFEYSTVENLKREIKIQKKIEHPHITKLISYFEDKENVYLVLEYAENGSLFHYLRRKKRFTEQEAFVYFFQTCLGIDYLHKKNIIHRDLKPENLLLDRNGNVKLCDFGWSAENNSLYQKRTTFCGTIDYMAPEMIQNKSHDFSLDIWCLGVLLYELLHGHTPFRGRNDVEKCTNIVNALALTFDESISSEGQNLIRMILKINPQERPLISQIFQHSWMKKWENVFKIKLDDYIFKEDHQRTVERPENTQLSRNASHNQLNTSTSKSQLQVTPAPSDKTKSNVTSPNFFSETPHQHVKKEAVFSIKDFSNPFMNPNLHAPPTPVVRSNFQSPAELSPKPHPVHSQNIQEVKVEETAREQQPTLGKVSVTTFLDQMKLKDDPEIELLNRVEAILSKKPQLTSNYAATPPELHNKINYYTSKTQDYSTHVNQAVFSLRGKEADHHSMINNINQPVEERQRFPYPRNQEPLFPVSGKESPAPPHVITRGFSVDERELYSSIREKSTKSSENSTNFFFGSQEGSFGLAKPSNSNRQIRSKTLSKTLYFNDQELPKVTNHDESEDEWEQRERGRNSRPVRQLPAANRCGQNEEKEIVEELSFFDRLLDTFGCLYRDKRPGHRSKNHGIKA